MVARGDLALVLFPFSALEARPFKKRPVLILGQDGVGVDEAILCVMVTGNRQRFQSPGRADVPVQRWQAAGLAMPSVIRSQRVWTAQTRDIARAIGSVDTVTLAQVESHVLRLLTP